MVNTRLPKIEARYHRLPRRLLGPLRNIVNAVTAKEVFAGYCLLFDTLGSYLINLANSVYLARPAQESDARLEKRLRGVRANLSLGTKSGGIQAFGASSVDFTAHIPQLDAVLRSTRLPGSCARMLHAFTLIKEGREQFAVPPTHLAKYVEMHLDPNAHVEKCSLHAVYSTFVPFRNQGHGHLDGDGWFADLPEMFEVVCEHLTPAIDDLITWSPLHELLCDYEIVEVVEMPRSLADGCPVRRNSVAEGLAPLGKSRLMCASHPDLGVGAYYVARRTELDSVLHAVVRHVKFPQTLQSNENLGYRYAETYLDTYLDNGLISPTQRESVLAPLLEELALRDVRQIEEAIVNEGINRYFDNAEQGLRGLATTLGPRWEAKEQRVCELLRVLPTRRKDYIFEQIDNNGLMNFDELRRESELSEPDLQDVLADLAIERRVCLLNADAEKSSYYRAQDPRKPTRLRTMLSELQHQHRRDRPLPAALWRIVELCAELLEDEGVSLDEGELDHYKELFADGAQPVAAESTEEEGAMRLYVPGREIQANSVRELLTSVWVFVRESGVDSGPVVPLLMGKTRHLVSSKPVHANGTEFKIPIVVDDVIFEGNLGRTRALSEAIRLLDRLGIEANSPGIEQPRRNELGEDESDMVSGQPSQDVDVDGEEVDDDDEPRRTRGLMLKLTPPDGGESVTVEGATVRRFFSALFDLLYRHGAAIDQVVPVATGRVRYFLAEEPYHRNDRPFDSYIEKQGYYINTAYTYTQALSAARALANKLRWSVESEGQEDDGAEEDATPLEIMILNKKIVARSAPNLLREVIKTLFDEGILDASDVPYKVGRVRYLIAEKPTHDHGRDFIRPIELVVDGHRYFIEANVSRQGALDLVERLMASKLPHHSMDEES